MKTNKELNRIASDIVRLLLNDYKLSRDDLKTVLDISRAIKDYPDAEIDEVGRSIELAGY